MNNNESDWFTICDEKNIILEKNSNNAYKITFSIHSTGGEETVLNVLKNGQLFELLSALNPDVIDKINVTEQTHNVEDVFITFKNNSNHQDDEELDKIINVYFSLLESPVRLPCNPLPMNTLANATITTTEISLATVE